MNPNARARRPQFAFSLIELLVVIAIIGVLAALLLPVSGIVMAQSRSTKCASNMRQIGKAILSYCTEHEDTLPGPLSPGQFPNPQPGTPGSLAVMLSPYLGSEDKSAAGGSASTEINRANVFLCPGYEQHFRKADGVVFAMNMRKLKQHGQSAWGDASQDQQPLKKVALSNWIADTEEGTDRQLDLTRTYALKDTDQEDLPEEEGEQPIQAPRAPKPVHGEHRNALFFDFHVGKLDVKKENEKKR